MDFRWVNRASENTSAIRTLKTSLGISQPLAIILASRGIENFDAAKDFFRPSIEKIHSPFLMKGMEKAVERIETALGDQEKILIYGDYDVDGTTAVATVFSFFNEITSAIDYYIPDRYKEGYGVSFQAIDFAAEHNFTLIISLDCGIKAVDKVAYAKEKGIDFIICDHHTPGKTLPPAVAILDPKQEDCNYPYDELSGCGIGFKLIHAYALKNNISFDKLLPYLDLLMVSIGSDIVPMTGENRILAYHGLKRLNESPRTGFKQLIELANFKKALTVTDVVFTIGPRINAAGRMESGKKAVQLLISGDPVVVEKVGKSIDANNKDRKELDRAITKEALEIIEENEELKKAKTTVVYQQDWHKGVIGIVASRLIENYYRPTIVLTKSGDKVAGSARSVVGFNVYDAIDKCSDVIEQFGGHKYAAGLTMKEEQVPLFQKKFEQVVASSIPDDLLIPSINIDAEIDLNQITPKFFRILKQFAPFGPGNMRPVFSSQGILDRGFAKIVGDNHLKMNVYQDKNEHIKFNAIGFNLGQKMDIVQSGVPFKIAYTVEENEWQGNVTLQLKIKDIKPQVETS